MARAAGPILIVEDDRDIAESMAELVRLDGYEATVAGDGREALLQLRVGPLPSCILLDLMMPVMSGWDFLATLHDDRPEYLGIPVIVVSAAHEPKLPEGVRLLPKPLDLGTLTRAIHDAVTP
jgi:CheY-like chemotaxis protein